FRRVLSRSHAGARDDLGEGDALAREVEGGRPREDRAAGEPRGTEGDDGPRRGTEGVRPAVAEHVPLGEVSLERGTRCADDDARRPRGRTREAGKTCA